MIFYEPARHEHRIRTWVDIKLGKKYDYPRNLSGQFPSPASTTERALSIFRANGGILKTQRAMNLGIHPRTLYALRDDALLERLDRGLYRLAEAKPFSDPDFVIVALKVPRGVICLISALVFHQLTTQIPHTIFLAIAANDQAPVLRYPPIRLFWYSKTAFENGAEEVDLDGAKVRIYSPERTLADCFKYRNKIGIDVCVEALNLYRRRGRMRLDELEKYGKLCRVERVMRPYMEAIL